MPLSKQAALRVAGSLLLAMAPLTLLASGCGGGNSSVPTPTTSPTATATTTGTPDATTTATSSPTATTAPTPFGTPALGFTNLGTGFERTPTNYEEGWRFRPTRDIRITAIGFYDQGKDGLATSHDVGIFNTNNFTLGFSATVLPTDPLIGFFRYHTLTTPLLLESGHDYAIAAVLNSPSDSFATAVNPLNTSTNINFEGSVSKTTGGSGLEYPDITSQSTYGNFGPSFLFTVD